MDRIYVGLICFLATLSLLFTPALLQAQRGFEVTPFIGYQLSGSVPYVDGRLDIKNSDDFGVAVNVPLPFREGMELELLFLHMNTELRADRYSYGVIVETQTFDTMVEYYQIGGVNVLEIPGSNVKPFGVLTLGASRFNPRGSARGEEWFFSGTLGAGVKVMASERIGIRLQGRLLLPFQFGSAGLWCGTGGCSIGVGSTSVFLQGDFTAGLIIAL